MSRLLNLTSLFSVAVALAVAALVFAAGRVVEHSVRAETLDGAALTVRALADAVVAGDRAQAPDQLQDVDRRLQRFVSADHGVEGILIQDASGRVVAAAGDALSRDIPADGTARMIDDAPVARVPLRMPYGQEATMTAALDGAVARASISKHTEIVRRGLGIAGLVFYLALLPAVRRGSRAVASSADARHRRVVRDLRDAMRNGRFELHYQPIRTIADGQIRGVEALVRMRAADGTLVPPSAFIPEAERSGFIETLGRWVLAEACRQAAEWRDAGLALSVAVNVAPQQIRDGRLVDVIEDALAAHGLPPETLTIELTESALQDDMDAVRATIQTLRDRGVRCALDDFGADWSSLGRLREVALDTIKVDRSFLLGVPGEERAERLLRAVVDLGAALDVRVVVEGVETAAQLETLIALGCDDAQGFWIGRPGPPEDVVAALAGPASSAISRDVGRAA